MTSATPKLKTPFAILRDTVLITTRGRVNSLSDSEYRIWIKTFNALNTIVQKRPLWDSSSVPENLSIDDEWLFEMEWERKS